MNEKKLATLSWPKLLIVSLLLPPLGIALWWLRPWGSRTAQRAAGITGRLIVSVALVGLTLTYLVQLNVLHMELSGAGWMPIFSLHDPDADQKALEEHRAAQQATSSESAAPAISAAVPVSEKPVESKVAVSPETVHETASPTIGPGQLWPDFRGAKRDGVYRDGPIFTRWPSEGLKPVWKQPVGGGYASFVIARGRAFTIEQRRDEEVVAAYDVATGRELWTDGWKALFSESMGGDGPRATPTWDEGILFALGATGEFRCYEAESGKVLWSKNILTDNKAQNITWGMSNSPLVVDDKVIVTPGGRGRSVVAYDKSTGRLIWGSLDDQAAYTSPMLITIAGMRQLLVVTAKRLVGLNVGDGALLWEHPWRTMYDVNSAQPIVIDANHVFVSAGYDHGSELIEVSRKNGGFSARTVWESKSLKNRFNSSVFHNGFIYGFDESIFACIDARTGERKWKGGRYGYGQALLAGDYILVLSESGDLVLLEATPEAHREVARSPAIEGKTWNHPAIAGGMLLVRNAREMAAFRLAP